MRRILGHSHKNLKKRKKLSKVAEIHDIKQLKTFPQPLKTKVSNTTLRGELLWPLRLEKFEKRQKFPPKRRTPMAAKAGKN